MELWYPKAVRVPGVAWKVHGKNTNKGAVLHSAVGFKAGLLDELRGPKDKGWHFSDLQDGTILQHYPLDALVYHCSNAFGNGQYIGIEHEGGLDPEDEPLTPAQLRASIDLVKWIAEQGKWLPSRTSPKTLFEHKEVALKYTQCPSGRIPWKEIMAEPLISSPMTKTDAVKIWTKTAGSNPDGVKITPLPMTSNPARRVYEVELP